MSNIEENLNKILSSRFGEDVRQAIHDGIHDCYEDGKSGSLDLVAREQIANLIDSGSIDGNSEVLDIRVSADSTTHSTAGESVRSQISSISENYFLKTPNFNPRRSVNEYGQETIIQSWSLSDWIPVFKNQKITISGYSGNICLYDINKELSLYKAAPDSSPYVTKDVSLTPTEDGYVRFSVLSNGGIYDVDKNTVGITYHYGTINGNMSRFYNYENPVLAGHIEPCHFGLKLLTKFNQLRYEQGIYSQGGVTSDNQNYYRSIDYIPVVELTPYWIYKMYTITGHFYDQNYNYIGDLLRLENYDDGMYTTDFAVFFTPKNACYLRINCGVADFQNQCIGFGDSPISSELIDDLPTTVELPYVKARLLDSEKNMLSFSVWEGKTCAVIGDSISYQDGKPYAQEGQDNYGIIARGWQTIVKERLGFAAIDNYAISGQTMAKGSLNENYAGSGIESVRSVNWSEKQYDLVIIAEGTNDFKLNIPMGNEFENVETTFSGAYMEAIETIITASPETRIVLFTPLHRNNDGYNSLNYKNTQNLSLFDYVNKIKDIGALTSSPVCDMFGNSGINYWNVDEYTMDGLHPDDKGYVKMGNYAAAFLTTVPL